MGLDRTGQGQAGGLLNPRLPYVDASINQRRSPPSETQQIGGDQARAFSQHGADSGSPARGSVTPVGCLALPQDISSEGLYRSSDVSSASWDCCTWPSQETKGLLGQGQWLVLGIGDPGKSPVLTLCLAVETTFASLPHPCGLRNSPLLTQ